MNIVEEFFYIAVKPLNTAHNEIKSASIGATMKEL